MREYSAGYCRVLDDAAGWPGRGVQGTGSALDEQLGNESDTVRSEACNPKLGFKQPWAADRDYPPLVHGLGRPPRPRRRRRSLISPSHDPHCAPRLARRP